MTHKHNSRLFLLCFLGILSAFGPFVMDMYLPTLPSMVDYFHTSSSMVQLGLTGSMVGLALGQLLFGPLSDRYGRRTPLLVAMLLFLASTVGCIYADNIFQFVVLRFFQGVAGAGGVVISRSIATDEYSGHQLAGVLAVIGGINGIATVAAPIGGGMLAHLSGWQGIFWFLFAVGLLLLLGNVRFCESLPVARRHQMGWKDFMFRFKDVLGNRRYLCYILQYGFTLAVLFVNIASAPFIMQQHYGLSPVFFSFCFGLNSVAMILASAVSVKLPSMERALYLGSRGMLVVSILLFLALSYRCAFWLYELLVFALLSMVGMAFTASSTLAMDCERQNAGVASALLGAVGFAFGGLVSPLVGIGSLMISAGLLFVSSSVCVYVCNRYMWERTAQAFEV